MSSCVDESGNHEKEFLKRKIHPLVCLEILFFKCQSLVVRYVVLLEASILSFYGIFQLVFL